MNTAILRLLRYDARAWWYHAQLRRQGRVGEARRLERRSIRSTVATMRRETPVEHWIASHTIEFQRRDVERGPISSGHLREFGQTFMLSGIHTGEWRAWHLRQGWACCNGGCPYCRDTEPHDHDRDGKRIHLEPTR